MANSGSASSAGIFAIGERPTGNKDPFGLRRAALGVQRILIEKGLELDLRRLIDLAVAGVRLDIDRLRAQLPAATPPKAHVGADVIAGWIYDFLMERLRVYYLERAGSAFMHVSAPGPAGGPGFSTLPRCKTVIGRGSTAKRNVPCGSKYEEAA